MRLFLYAVLLLATQAAPPLSPPTAAAADEDLTRADTEENELFRLAGSLFESGRYPAAAKHYRDFLRRFSAHRRAPDAQMMLAESLHRQALAEAAGAEKPSEKAFAEASKEYQAALKAIPKGDLLAAAAAFRLGEIEFDLQRHDAALAAFARMQADHPGGLLRGEARILEAQSLLARGRASEAAQVLRALVKDQPFYAGEDRASLALGAALFQVGDSSGALAQLERLEAPLAHLYAARALINLGKPLVAVERLRQLQRADPDGPYREIAAYLIAESFFSAKDYLSAISAYESFLRSWPQSPYRSGSMYKIGLCQYERGDYLAARGSFQSVLQMTPNSEFAELSLYMTGETFLKEGRLKEAGYAYGDMATSFTSALSGNAQFKLAWTLMKQNELPAAETALRQMTVKHPNHPLTPPSLMLLGNVLSRLERHAEAVLAYQQALDMLPAAAMEEERRTELREACLALLNRANLRGKDYGRLVSGYQYILKHVKPTLNPWRAATLLYIAEGYFRQGFYDEALALYRSVLESYPASPESALAVDGTAWSLFRKGEYAKAEAERRKLESYRRRPPPAPTKTVLPDGKLEEGLFVGNEFESATALFNQKRYLEALDAYEAFEKAHPEHPLAAEAALQTGWCYYRLEYYGQSIKAWERVESAYRGTPVAAQAAWSTADTYFRAGQYEQAIATYKRILQAYPQDPSLDHARLRIAQSHYNAKDVPKAIAAFEELLLASPDSSEAVSVLDFLTQLLYRPEAKAAGLESLVRIAEAKPGSLIAARARFRVARHHFEAKDHEAAARELEKVTGSLAGAEEPADAQYYLAESYYALKRYKDAALAYERFTSNYPGDQRLAGAFFHLGAARFQLKDFAEAAAAFRKVVSDWPKAGYAPVALYNSALAYRKLGKWEEAALALKSYLKDHPAAAKTSNAASELVAVYEEHHQFALAVETIKVQREALAKDDALRLELSYRLAEDLGALGQEEAALAEYRALVASAPRSDPYRLSALAKLGELHERKEQWSDALAVYEDMARSSTKPEWAEAAKARAQAAKEKLSQAKAGTPPAPAKGKTQ